MLGHIDFDGTLSTDFYISSSVEKLKIYTPHCLCHDFGCCMRGWIVDGKAAPPVPDELVPLFNAICCIFTISCSFLS